MKEYFTDKLNNLFESFSNTSGGYSGKKLTALAITLCIVAIHVKWLIQEDNSQMEMILTIDYTFVLTLFGINVVDKFKNKNNDTKSE